MSPKSIRTINGVREIVDENLPDCCELEVIDIYQHPELARREQIIATPTLIKRNPLPIRRKIGEITNKDRIIADLDLFSK
jgi:circadian clock protein KaiB